MLKGSGSAKLEVPPKVCLIGGTGRSGTTILKTVFSGHPDAVKIPEFRFQIDPDGLIDFYNAFRIGWSPYHWDVKLNRLEQVLRQVSSRSFFKKALSYVQQRYDFYRFLPFGIAPKYGGIEVSRYSPSFDRLSDQLVDSLTAIRFKGQWSGTSAFGKNEMRYGNPADGLNLEQILGGFWRAVIIDVCSHQGKGIYLDANTWMMLWMDKVVNLLPEARLVHIYRDPRDVVASYVMMRWAPNQVEDAARWYKGVINRWFSIREILNTDSYYEIALEDLVQHTEERLEEICRFWNIPWTDSLLGTKLNKANTGRWKREFNSDEQKMLNQVLADEIRALGYD